MARNTRQRILIAALLLFNEKGVSRTSLNEIADEIDISPGNLHYHFKKKSDIVDALVAEFQADARTVLQAPDSDTLSIDDFWLFLHLLLEFTAAYRFLLRDTESLAADYPKGGRALHHFAKSLDATFGVYLLGLARNGALALGMQDVAVVSRNLTLIALLSEQFDELMGEARAADEASLHIALSRLRALTPSATADAATEIKKWAAHSAE